MSRYPEQQVTVTDSQVGNITQTITQFFTGGVDEQRTLRTRRTMLERVKNFWVKGVLEKSLHGALMIELGMEEQVDAVERPWDMTVQTPHEPCHLLPPGTKIVEVFDEMEHALLMLGAPGSGKTTMLLELARDTIARAERDTSQPIPVVFNLSSWTDKEQSILDWLVNELNSKYNIPKKIAHQWVENEDLLLLLDGLDEVKSERRQACVEAINIFRDQHGLTPIAICSRIADYETVTTRLKLNGAVVLQPLTFQQIDTYLEGSGIELEAVRKTLLHDILLQELAESPLMLSVMTFAYRGMSADDLQALRSIEDRRRHVLDTYVKQMFKRRGGDRSYSPEQTESWLVQLAQKMSQRAQTIFLIEGLQPGWLSSLTWICIHVLVSRLIGGVSVVLAFGLGLGVFTAFFTESNDSIAELLASFIYGASSGVIVGLTVALIDIVRFTFVQSAPAVKNSPTRLEKIINVLLVGLVIALLQGWGVSQTYGVRSLYNVMTSGLVIGLLGGLIFGLRGSRQSLENDVEPVEALRWSWRRAIRNARWGFLAGLTIVGIVGTLFYLFGYRGANRFEPILDVATGTILGGVAGALSVALLSGLERSIVETKIAPNQGIRLSFRNAVFVTSIVILIVTPVTGLAQNALLKTVFGGQTPIAIDGLMLGLVFGLLASLWFGGLDIIQHFTLRFILCLNGIMPWNYARFLDYAAERIFLRKVGGGYIFIHRLLLEYFAALGQKHTKKTTYIKFDPSRQWITVALLLVGGCVFANIALHPFGIYDRYFAYLDFYRGQEYVLRRDPERALVEFRKATDLASANKVYWNALCWYGSLYGHAAEVMPACARAVELAPNDGALRDSRGLARALTGDRAGAIEDFRFAVKWFGERGLYEKYGRTRETWVTELEAGRNPFDEETLQRLLSE